MSIQKLHNESALILEMQEGNENAFAALYKHYSPHLYLNVLRMVREPQVAEDIIQELFSKIWQKRNTPAFRENFEGYIFRTGQNLVRDHLRKVTRDQKLLERFRQLAAENYTEVEEALFSQYSTAILEKAIAQLPPQQRKVYELVRIQKRSYKEAAAMMGVSPNTVKEYLGYTRKSIKDYVLNHLDADHLILLLLLAAVPSGS